ncbi:hypothetical protein C4K04_3963 [Pseudomonas chlororaphis]|uniref:Uncharacterized protein n=1 Tax=Pseudomonas chlororaphis TaxID=587753 RepID=A0A3G7TTB7_9PSED|nr:hypothetical protein C4K04_3963 [Pseudomonas chlororaphis]
MIRRRVRRALKLASQRQVNWKGWRSYTGTTRRAVEPSAAWMDIRLSGR